MGILQDNAAAPVAQPAPDQGAPAAAPQDPGGQLPPPNPDILSPVVKKHIPALEQMQQMLTGKMGDAYDRVLTAGMKMLYSPQTADVLHKLIFDEKIPLPNKLGEGVANLLVMMDNQGNGTIPKEVLVPVGVALLFEATDYLFECGINATDDDLGEALELMINGIFVGYGIDPAKMDQIVNDMGKKLGFDDTPQGKEVAGMKDKGAPADDVENAADAAAEGPGGEQAEDSAFEQGFTDEQDARNQAKG